VPTILIADDNSNIHKMVETALKDFGYKIEKVGNGEHAVRKLPDIKPDLILADIFMPVRNGYEVCEYVKNNEQFAHIPVVLLQGKFDPLDEHLMKKVRADGILMKPFVPDEPLKHMVQTLLEESAAARATAEALKAKPGARPDRTVEMSPAEIERLTGKKEEPEPEVAEYATAPPPVEISEGEQPMAFGDLLEPSAAPVEAPAAPAEEGFRASSVAGMDFETPAAEPEAAPEAPSWGGIEEELKQPSPDEPPIKVEFAGETEPMELVTDEPSFAPSSVAASGPLPELATNPDEWMSSGPPKVEVPPDEESSWVSAPTVAPTVAAAPPIEMPPAPPMEIPAAAEPEPVAEPAPPMVEPEPEPAPIAQAYAAPTLEEMPAPPPQMDAVPAAAPEPPPVEAPAPPPPAPSAAAAPAPAVSRSFAIPTPVDLALVDAVVEKVIERLKPEVIDRITREIVRPLVEAILRQESER
jgi:CheY-like chemotaxis protein